MTAKRSKRSVGRPPEWELPHIEAAPEELARVSEELA